MHGPVLESRPQPASRGPCADDSGMTVRGATGWRQARTSYAVYADVDTVRNGFTDTSAYPVMPRLFTGLRGGRWHWATSGAHIAYMPRCEVCRCDH